MAFDPKEQSISKTIAAFFIAKKAAKLSPNTLRIYGDCLSNFTTYAAERGVTTVGGIDADLLRRWLLTLEETGHNSGGAHTHFRTARTWLRWFEREYEPDGWRNPIAKVKPPKLDVQPLDPVTLETLTALLETCQPRGDKLADRDRAILLCLLDTGARITEFLSLNIQDVDPTTGAVRIVRGKGGKPRTVFLGERSRRALRAWLRHVEDDAGALWRKRTGERMKYESVRMMFVRRARLAGVPEPSPHDFRRAFALESLRAGMDLLSLARLLGHADLQMVRRYVAQTDEDLRQQHSQHSPVDRAKLTG
jgi:site-specific recombinase XerD